MATEETIRDAAHRGRPDLFAELAALLRETYEDPELPLRLAWNRNDTLYLARDDGGRVVSFFLAAWETLEVGGARWPAAYLGFGATASAARGRGHLSRHLDRFVADVRRREAETGARLVLWGTTASPLSFYPVAQRFVDVEPDRAGALSPGARELVLAVRRRYPTADLAAGEHPCVLRGIAPHRYSATERGRTAGGGATLGIDVFARLGIDESRGDRLLFVCRAPVDAAGSSLVSQGSEEAS